MASPSLNSRLAPLTPRSCFHSCHASPGVSSQVFPRFSSRFVPSVIHSQCSPDDGEEGSHRNFRLHQSHLWSLLQMEILVSRNSIPRVGSRDPLCRPAVPRHFPCRRSGPHLEKSVNGFLVWRGEGCREPEESEGDGLVLSMSTAAPPVCTRYQCLSRLALPACAPLCRPFFLLPCHHLFPCSPGAPSVCLPPLHRATSSLGRHPCLGSVCPASQAAQPHTMEWRAKLTVTLKAPASPLYPLPLVGLPEGRENKQEHLPPKPGKGMTGGIPGKGRGLSDLHFHY